MKDLEGIPYSPPATRVTTSTVDAQEAVDRLFGVGRAKVVDAITSTKVTEHEVILVNGTPVQLVGPDGDALKKALLEGRLPDQSIINKVLASVLGPELKGVTKMESSVTVSSKVTTRDTLTVHHNGKVIDERTAENKYDTVLQGHIDDTFKATDAIRSIFSSACTTPNSSPRPPLRASRTSSTTSKKSSSRASSRTSRSPSNTSKPPSPNSFPSNSGSSSPAIPYRSSRISTSSGSSGLGSSSGCSSGGSPPIDPISSILTMASPNAVRLNVSSAPESSKGVGKLSLPSSSMQFLVPSVTSLLPPPSPLVESLAKADLNRDEVDSVPININGRCKVFNPTIFGTVAGDQCPRDSTKRGLPQTPKGGGLRGSQDGGAAPEWATLPDDDNSLVYEDGVLVSGSLQALVQHATPTASYYPDTAYLFAFLLSSRLFIKPHELLQRVSDLGFTQQGLQEDDISSVDKDKMEKFVVHLVQLLGEWSETFPYDFRDERVMSCVRTITHRCIALQPNLRRDVTQILHNLLNKLTHLERYEESLAKHTVAPPADSLSDVPDITEICSSPLVMAQQLTHIELERLSFIGPEEFVQAFAKDSNIDSSYKDLKKTNNLEVYVQWFNKLSYSVATQAVSHLKKKQRVRVIEWWIEVARECFNIGNFNSLMGIIAGLNMSPVSRLKKTWSKVQTAKFSVLEHQMDPTSNFSSYRSTLKAAMWRSAGAVDDRQKIVIPFFSLLVKDLYFLNEGCASRLPNGYINFDKFWQLAKQVTEFMAWKQVTCPFERVPHVINYLQSASILSEIGLAHSSFECEGPENSYEKERYKNLSRAESQPSS
ncbi:ras-GEF domain-containing family member 1B isoform X3 [Hyalella azteca]|uniref:Ras-GEF domain-containing family member 1B isoform X3 n=1 Tax=Hyalella azteca TaxID=294128 RepID=A0A8B7NK78_HYAAZ|nr:ras-GEF domain-containing family member 1B isoform X3 [Hyalella azteca]